MAVELVPGVTVTVEAPRPTFTPVKDWLEAVLALPMTESAPSRVTGAVVNVSVRPTLLAPTVTVSVWLMVIVPEPVMPVTMAPEPMPVPAMPWPMARPAVLETLIVLVAELVAPERTVPAVP